MSLIVVIFALGVLLLGLELVLPGGIVGLIGGVLIFVSGILGMASFGLNFGLGIWFCGILIGVLFLYLEIKLITKSKFVAKHFQANRSIEGGGGLHLPETLIGAKGLTLTKMVPSGKVEIEGQLYPASALDGYLEKGRSVIVKEVKATHLLVSTQK